MIPLFTKRLDTLDTADVAKLWEEEVQEGQRVEFKSELPTKDGTAHPWLNGKGSIGEYARDKLLKEVIAFANSTGGNLVVGIEESGDKPAKATGAKPLPRCHDLADQIRRMAGSKIEPQLPVIEVRGIELEEESDEGVVLVRVPKSRMAPHRLIQKKCKECYIRRADESVPMTMWEIQNKCIDLSRGLAAIERRLEDRHKSFEKGHHPNHAKFDYEGGVRVTALPVGGEISLPQPYREDRIRDCIRKEVSVSIEGQQAKPIYWHGTGLSEMGLQPMLRGATREDGTSVKWTRQEVHSDGLVEFTHRKNFRFDTGDSSDNHFHVGEILAQVVNAVEACRLVLEIEGSIGAEILLDIELSLKRPGYVPTELRLGQGTTSKKNLGAVRNPIRLPFVTVPPDEDISEAVRTVANDLLNAVGKSGWESLKIVT